MTVVFRPAHREPAALDEFEVFDNGERIPDALIHTGPKLENVSPAANIGL
jgi:hypothetical protein